MARKVFFSFYYERDVWRAGQVRNSWVTKLDREAAGFWDSASWESIKKQGDDAVKNWINKQLEGTSVTVVLIGAETSKREYVLYEIQKSYDEGKGMIGIYIHNMKDSQGNIDYKGENPFDKIYVTATGIYLSGLYPTYDWIFVHRQQSLDN